MNQILVTEKLYVTPELKRKKRIYKINFIISIVIIVILCSFYVHSEYARNKEQEISEDIINEVIGEQEQITKEEREMAQQDSDVWKIMISSVQQNQTQQQSNTQEQQNQTNSNNSSTTSKSSKNTNKKKKTNYITASNGKRYPSIGRIQIPKINVDLAILAESSENLVEWLKVSPVKFWGADPNEIGNFSIAGHNYRNKKFFSKVPTLEEGDRLKITDVNGKTMTYEVFDKYTVEPENTDCIYPVEGKENKRVVTLITCTNDSKKRVIVQAEEI